jgi:hypothetical protein
VALCFSVSALHGSTVALAIGAGFATLSSVLSWLSLAAA